jgi:hypothetical protein
MYLEKMKTLRNLKKILLATIVLFGLGCSNTENDSINPLNAIIGNQSYVELFGYKPTINTSETKRIKTHLLWVGDQLKKADVSHLSSEQKTNRLIALKLLYKYQNFGVFPTNTLSPVRRPCFRDDDGRLCAMAYLIENTAGSNAVDMLNENNQYTYLLDMDLPLLSKWSAEYGLSLVECATIQPTYKFKKHPYKRKLPGVEDIVDGYQKVYNDDKQILMDGKFKRGQLYNGKWYKYDANGLLEKIEVFKKGEYHGDCLIDGRSKKDSIK